jgi:hypothetical protein
MQTVTENKNLQMMFNKDFIIKGYAQFAKSQAL